MKKWILFSLISAIGTATFAVPNKEFSCKNVTGLPNNVYKFTSTSFGTNMDLPFIETTRYARETPGDANSRVVEYKVKGLGTLLSIDGKETVMLGTMRFEFDGDELTICKK